jgi:hypothetical protein
MYSCSNFYITHYNKFILFISYDFPYMYIWSINGNFLRKFDSKTIKVSMKLNISYGSSIILGLSIFNLYSILFKTNF